MIAIALNNINKYYGAAEVLRDISFEIHCGEKVGIVGKNGSGKSTLLKLILGVEGEYSGNINIKKNSTFGYVDQIPNFTDSCKVVDVLNLAFSTQHKIYEELKSVEGELKVMKEEELARALNRYAELQESYERLGGYEIEERLSKICIGLSFDEELLERCFNTLSGGEKTTVLLGKMLLQAPEILLLDEPSNHLDLKSIEWLEEFIRSYKGTVIIVSHDRYFLDNTVTKVIELENMGCRTYDGNYSKYVEQKREYLMLQAHAYENQQKKINEMEEAIKRFRHWGAIGDNEDMFKKAFSMEKRLEKMDKIERPKLSEDKMKLDLQFGERSGKDVVIIENAAKSFGSKVILKNANLAISYGEKLALIGDNGCGKSTLLKIILNSLEGGLSAEDYSLDSGCVKPGSSLKVGYLPQEIEFKNEDSTVLECFREDICYAEGKSREYLAKFLIYGEEVFKKVRNLSGGERSRLLLAKLLFNEVNALILDEPTNHLDIPSREALEETLRNFKGSILFVSHDRYFINTLCSSIVELKGGELIPYVGNYEYYKEKIKKIENEDVETYKKQNVPQCAKNTEQKLVEGRNERKILLLEGEIEKLEKEIEELKEEMNKTDQYERLRRLYESVEELSLKLENCMEQWMELIG